MAGVRREGLTLTGTGGRLGTLIDVDNTLIDNDAVKADLRDRIAALVGPAGAESFWDAYERVRRERDVVDFPLTLGRFRERFADARRFARVSALVLAYPYEASLFPRALDVLGHLRRWGPVTIVSDGDPVYQPAKIARAGLADAVDDVVITVHKERELPELLRGRDASRHLLVDDKPGILAGTKERLGDAIVTVHVCQGRYAHAADHDRYPRADVEVDRIADLLDLDPTALR